MYTVSNFVSVRMMSAVLSVQELYQLSWQRKNNDNSPVSAWNIASWSFSVRTLSAVSKCDVNADKWHSDSGTVRTVGADMPGVYCSWTRELRIISSQVHEGQYHTQQMSKLVYTAPVAAEVQLLFIWLTRCIVALHLTQLVYVCTTADVAGVYCRVRAAVVSV